MEYTLTDEIPKEGDWAVSTEYTIPVPRIVVKKDDVLGFDLSKTNSWFKWLPLREHHRKVILK